MDRTNFSPEQRAYFLSLISSALRPGGSKPLSVLAIHLCPPKAVLHARLAARTGHPTIQSYAQAKDILRRFERDMVPPSIDEGFDRVLVVRDEVPLGGAGETLLRCWAEGERRSLWSEGGWAQGSPVSLRGGRGGSSGAGWRGARGRGGSGAASPRRSDGDWRR